MWKISTYIAPCKHEATESLFCWVSPWNMIDVTWTTHTWVYYPTYCRLSSCILVCAIGHSETLFTTNFPRQRLLPTDRQSHQYSSPGVQIFKTTGIWDLTFLSKNLIYRFHSDNFPRSRIFETQLEILVNGLTLTRNRHFVLFLLETHLGYVEVLSRFHLPHKAPWECWVAIGFFLLRIF